MLSNLPINENFYQRNWEINSKPRIINWQDQQRISEPNTVTEPINVNKINNKRSVTFEQWPVSVADVLLLRITCINDENRMVEDEWTQKYMFVPVSCSDPVCFICSKSVALVTSANMKHHYETKTF